MKKYLCVFLILFSFKSFSQDYSKPGQISFRDTSLHKDKTVNNKQGYLTSNVAYGYSLSSFKIISVPILPGYPITSTYLIPQTIAFAWSMCLGGDGNFYVTTPQNSIYQFNPVTRQIGWQHIDVSGLLPSDLINGISYNYANNKYYLAAGGLSNHCDNIYEVNISTGIANLIGPTNTGGMQADLTIDCEGNCYSYDLVTNNSYKIDLETGSATLLGPLGFNPVDSQGMDFDRENGIVYLSVNDSTTMHAQLRELNTITGEATLITDWGYHEWIAPFAISTKCYNDCSLDASVNPYPPSGSFGVSTSLDSLRWDNDAGVTNTEVFFGKIENLHLAYNGPAISSFPVPALEDQSLYVWRIKSRDGICTRYSSAWLFGTMETPEIDTLFEDDFENGLENWTIENVNGYCDWEIFQSPYPNHYVLPSSSSDGVLSADADNCGPQTSINSTATINQSFDFSIYNWVWLEFDSDWKNVNTQNHAMIDVSLNNGTTWTTIWDQSGNEIRTSTEITDASIKCAGKSNVKFRFRSDQQGWGWWWVIDNLKILGIACPTCTPRSPTMLHANNYTRYIQLHWTDNSYNEEGFSIERKLGDSLSTNEFEVTGTTLQNITSYIDTSVTILTEYTYRVNSFNENGNSVYSNWVTITSPLPVEITGFTASRAGNEVELTWTTVTEINNLGFEVQRKLFLNDKFTEYASIGFKNGFGTTTEPKNYSFHDNISHIDADSLYYRLKQVDFDGNSTFSKDVALQFIKIPAVYELYNNFPNPFNPTTKINFTLPEKSNVTINVYNAIGKLISTVVSNSFDAGYQSVNFNATGLPSGVYVYRIEAKGNSGTFIAAKKMLLLK